MARVINNTKKVAGAIDLAVKMALREIGQTGKVNLAANSPYKTGNLRRSHAYKVKGTRVVLGVSALAPYGKWVEFKPVGKGGNPWFRQTLKDNDDTFQKIIAKHLKGVGK